MEEALHLLELADGLANRVLQRLRNAKLAPRQFGLPHLLDRSDSVP